jgi:hypothetical protein
MIDTRHVQGYQVRATVDPCRGNLAGRQDRGSLSPNLYCDGRPQDEYLTFGLTESLLKHSKRTLAATVVGVSMMMGDKEDYDEVARRVEGAAFAELNLKYAGRVNKETAHSSMLIKQIWKRSLQRARDFSMPSARRQCSLS